MILDNVAILPKYILILKTSGFENSLSNTEIDQRKYSATLMVTTASGYFTSVPILSNYKFCFHEEGMGKGFAHMGLSGLEIRST